MNWSRNSSLFFVEFTVKRLKTLPQWIKFTAQKIGYRKESTLFESNFESGLISPCTSYKCLGIYLHSTAYNCNTKSVPMNKSLMQIKLIRKRCITFQYKTLSYVYGIWQCNGSASQTKRKCDIKVIEKQNEKIFLVFSRFTRGNRNVFVLCMSSHCANTLCDVPVLSAIISYFHRDFPYRQTICTDD